MYVVEIVNSNKPCWIAEWDGDPPRTIVFDNAQIFVDEDEASKRIEECKKFHPFKKIVYKITKKQ